MFTTPSQDPYDPQYQNDDEDDEFEERKPTLDDCIRLWLQAKRWYKHDSIYGMCDFAALTSEEDRAQLAIWLESVRRIRADGLVDTDTSYFLIWEIVDRALDAEPLMTAPELAPINKRMDDFTAAHGLAELEDFDTGSEPPGWAELEQEFEEATEEMRRSIIRAAGEGEMIRLMVDEPEEYKRRVGAAGLMVKQDFAAERARWSPLDDEWRERLGLA